MIVWQYETIVSGTNTIEELKGALNALGLDGWEMVGFAAADRTLGLNALVSVLKRRRVALAIPDGSPDEGWLPDPSKRHPDRYWDGSRWTHWVRDQEGGTRSEDDPYGEVVPVEG